MVDGFNAPFYFPPQKSLGCSEFYLIVHFFNACSSSSKGYPP